MNSLKEKGVLRSVPLSCTECHSGYASDKNEIRASEGTVEPPDNKKARRLEVFSYEKLAFFLSKALLNVEK